MHAAIALERGSEAATEALAHVAADAAVRGWGALILYCEAASKGQIEKALIPGGHSRT